MDINKLLTVSDTAHDGPFLVTFKYKDVVRIIEPYSYRNLGLVEASLYGYQLAVIERGVEHRKEKGHIQSFLFSGISEFQVLDRKFEPRNKWDVYLSVFAKCTNCGNRVRISDVSCSHCKAIFK